MMQDSNKSILSSAKRFFSGTLLSRFSGLFRDVMMAFAFGTHETVAAFLAAFRLAHLLRRILGEGCLQSAFIPLFEDIRKDDPTKAFSFFRDLTLILTLLLILIIAFSMLGVGSILYWGDLTSSQYEITFLLLLMMPSLLFICLFGLNASLLQCEKSYFTPSVAPVAFNFIWMLGVAFLWKTPAQQAMPWLACAVVLGCLFQWIMTVPATVRSLRHQISQPFSFQLLKKFLLPFFLGMTGIAATQINSALDTVFARFADSEGPALLWYAIRLEQLPLALFGIALSGALLPPLSRAIKNQDLASFRSFLQFAIRRSVGFALPMTLALLLMGDGCVNLLYGRGGFTDQSTIRTTQCLWGYALGLLPNTLVLILAPAFYAQGNYRTPALASFLSMVLNAGLNAWMVFGLGLGAASVALATSISALFNFGFLAWKLSDQIGHSFVAPTFLVEIRKIFEATSLASIGVLLVQYFLMDKMPYYPILWGESVDFPHVFLHQVAYLAVPGILYLALLFATAWIRKTEDLFLGTVRR